jgi:hypothetical protein
MAKREDLTIERGKTFTYVLRWAEESPIIYKAITGVSLTAPVVIDVNGHGAPNGWPIAVSGIRGTRQLNAENIPPRERDFHPATVRNSNQVELNDVDASLYSAYVSGGFIQYATPVDLTSAKSRFVVKDKAGNVLAAYDELAGITIDNAAKTITLSIPATTTTAYAFSKGEYEWEVEDSAGRVERAKYGTLAVDIEIATTPTP